MRIYDIIAKKRDGLALSEEEIRFFVSQYTQGMIPDYQASALLMAICINGMDRRENNRSDHGNGCLRRPGGFVRYRRG